jgi:predicted site-specific integrase-resolvase
MKHITSQLLTRRDTAATLSISVRSLIRLEQKGILHPIRLSRGLVRHNSEAVAEILNRRTHHDKNT